MTHKLYLSKHVVPVLILSILALGMIFWYGKINYHVEPFSQMDLQFYREMAVAAPNIQLDVPQPFIYRILGPYIVGVLFSDEVLGFYILSIVFSFILVWLFYSFLMHMKINSSIALITVIAYIFNKYLFGFTIWNYFQINDLLSLMILLILLMSLYTSHLKTYMIFLSIGMITREICIIMLPVSIIYAIETKQVHKYTKIILANIPGLAIFIGLRIFIEPEDGLNLYHAFMMHAPKLLILETWARLLFNSFVPFSFVPLIFFETTKKFFLQRKHLLVFSLLVFVTTLFGVDNERLMAPLFIVFYLLIAYIFQEFFVDHPYILSLMTVSGFAASIHKWIGQFPAPPRLAIIVWIITLIIVTISAYYVKRRTNLIRAADSSTNSASAITS